MDLDGDEILSGLGGIRANDLNGKLNLYEEIDNEIHTISHSPYVTISEIPDYLKNFKSPFSILSLNCQSINAKFGLIECLVHELKTFNHMFSVICLQETWLTDRSPDCDIFHIPGYQTIALSSTVGSHGGLMVYLKDCFRYEIKKINVPSKMWECLFLEVSGGNLSQPLIVGNIYRPPRNNNDNQTIRNFTNELSDVIENFTKLSKNILISGDFNINLLEINERECFGEFLDLMITNELFPKITLPTRRCKSNATLIDQMFCKFKDLNIKTKSGIVFGSTSDHYAYFSCFEMKSTFPHNHKYVKIDKCNDSAIESFISEIHSSHIYERMNKDLLFDPNVNYTLMENIILRAKEKHIPSKLVRFNKYKHKSSPWITNGILVSIRYRDKLHYQITRTPRSSNRYGILENNLREYKCILNRAIRQAKRDYYHRVLYTFKHSVKKIWSTLNEIIRKNKKTKSFPDSVNIDGKLITDQSEIANYFNKYFVSIGPTLAGNIDTVDRSQYKRYLTRVITTSFNFELTQPEVIAKIMQEFKPKLSYGHDGLSMKIIKRLKNTLIEPLSLLINQSLCTGIFPEKLKIAKICPIFKKGDVKNIDNYRPVSILPTLSKIFERVVYVQLYNYFTENNLLYKSQYGFRKGHSTEFAGLELIDNVIHKLDRRQLPISFFLDLSKAFDTLDHTILLHKLYYYGVDGVALEWFKNYLSNRKQFVQINDVTSSQLVISTGVPQGSILGPLLFLIYINDINNVSRHFHPILYADDTTLISTLCVFGNKESANELTGGINQELNRIQTWLSANKLSLNTNKTKYMIFHSVNYPEVNLPKLNLQIKGQPIEKVKNFDFLGLTISDTLRWQAHASKIANKISKSVGIMSRLKFFLLKDTLKMIYNSLIVPHLYFSVLAWGFECERLATLQKRAVRIIHRAKYNAHTEPLLKKSGLLSIQDIFDFQCAKFYYKFKHGSLPAYFDDRFFVRNNQIHNHNTRQSTDLHRFAVNKSKTEKCIRHYIPTLFNNLPVDLKNKFNTHSLAGFSHNYKQFLLSKYSEVCLLLVCRPCNRY